MKAALLILSCLAIPSPCFAQAESKPVATSPAETAQEQVERAEEAYAKEHFQEALEAFLSAAEQMRGHPAYPDVLYNAAQCLERLKRYDEALEIYQKGLAAKDPRTSEARKLTEQVETFKSSLGSISLALYGGDPSTPYKITVDGRLLPTKRETFSLPQGKHTIAVEKDGYEKRAEAIEVLAGTSQVLEWTLTPKVPVSEVDPYTEAKERVVRAEKLYGEGNFDAALAEFERAYGTMLGHPARSAVLFNMGRCLERLYRYDAAIDSYKRYLDEAPAEAEDRPQVVAKIEILADLLGAVEVTVTAKTGQSPKIYEVWVDGRLVGQGLKSFSVPGGSHQVEVRAPGFESKNRQVQLAARTSQSLSFELSPLAKEYQGLPAVYFWSAGGLALASAITGAVYGTLTLSKRSEVDNKLPPQVTEEDEEVLKRRALTADIFFLTAGLFTTTAVVLALNTNWSEGEEEEPDSKIRVKKMGLSPLTNGAFFALEGAF